MAKAQVRYREPLRLSRLLLVWSLVSALILVLLVALGYQGRLVQGQAEGAAIKVTLGALRTAFVLHHLQQQLPTPGGAGPGLGRGAVQRNPFALLQRRPPNYAGEMSASQALQLLPGSWLFDPDCSCIGYLPLYPQWLSSPSGESMIWFSISVPPELMQIKMRERYVWQGELLEPM